MQIPYRLAAALDSRRSLGMHLALGFSTVVLTATPFLLPEIADGYDIGLTAASLVGVTQLSGFALGSWVAGRWLAPTSKVLVWALLLAVVANTLSATLPPFEVLLALRLASGLAIGTITWFAWTRAFGQSKAMSRVAVIGPMIGVLATPAVAFVVADFGAAGLFLFLAFAAVIPLAFASEVPPGVKRERSERRPAVATARVVLVALTSFTLGGSAVFTFGVAIAAQELGLSPAEAAIAYTANAIVSIPAAGWRGRRGIPGPWMALTALCAFLLATSYQPWLFFAAVIAWGFCYWMAVPGVFAVLAAASAYPEERAGDAQAMMALGRVGGPFLGGLLLDRVGTVALGLSGAGLMLGAAMAVFAIREMTESHA